MKYYLGIDIGGTHIKGGIVNPLTNDIHQNIPPFLLFSSCCYLLYQCQADRRDKCN